MSRCTTSITRSAPCQNGGCASLGGCSVNMNITSGSHNSPQRTLTRSGAGTQGDGIDSASTLMGACLLKASNRLLGARYADSTEEPGNTHRCESTEQVPSMTSRRPADMISLECPVLPEWSRFAQILSGGEEY